MMDYNFEFYKNVKKLNKIFIKNGGKRIVIGEEIEKHLKITPDVKKISVGHSEEGTILMMTNNNRFTIATPTSGCRYVSIYNICELFKDGEYEYVLDYIPVEIDEPIKPFVLIKNK